MKQLGGGRCGGIEPCPNRIRDVGISVRGRFRLAIDILNRKLERTWPKLKPLAGFRAKNYWGTSVNLAGSQCTCKYGASLSAVRDDPYSKKPVIRPNFRGQVDRNVPDLNSFRHGVVLFRLQRLDPQPEFDHQLRPRSFCGAKFARCFTAISSQCIQPCALSWGCGDLSLRKEWNCGIRPRTSGRS